jgi:putative transposase
MTGEALREVFEVLLPTEAIVFFATQLGVVERERLFDVVEFVRAAVVATSSPSGGLQADIIRNYLESGAPAMARSALYRKFDEEFEKLMQVLVENALEYARQQELDLPGVLAGVKDWLIVDSSTVKVRNAAKDVLPGTGDYAAIKVHKTISVGSGAMVQYHFSPAREHDSKHLVIDEQWRGHGLLADLGYASLARLQACFQYEVKFVIRLKENWKPKVESIARGEVTREFLPGTDLDVLLESDILRLDGRAIDADVRVGSGSDTLHLRMVAIPSPKGYCFFLTNLPPRIGPHQVGELYRVRWEVELSFKLDKSSFRLDEGSGERVCSIKTLLHASLLSSLLTALIVHRHTLETRPKPGEEVRTLPPIHAGLVARCLIQWAFMFSRACSLEGVEAELEWARLARSLTHAAKDPNWRRDPSVLDQIRGWKRRPAPRQRKRAMTAPA